MEARVDFARFARCCWPEDRVMAFFADGETDTVSANGSVSFCNCCMPRRRFLVGLAAATAMSSRRAFAQAPEAKPAGKRIDVHHHFLPPQYMKEEHERINFGHGGVSASQMLIWNSEPVSRGHGSERYRYRHCLDHHARSLVRRRRGGSSTISDVELICGRASPQLSWPLRSLCRRAAARHRWEPEGN